jgi:hypothetical protein
VRVMSFECVIECLFWFFYIFLPAVCMAHWIVCVCMLEDFLNGALHSCATAWTRLPLPCTWLVFISAATADTRVNRELKKR